MRVVGSVGSVASVGLIAARYIHSVVLDTATGIARRIGGGSDREGVDLLEPL